LVALANAAVAHQQQQNTLMANTAAGQQSVAMGSTGQQSVEVVNHQLQHQVSRFYR
jgi:hypothetical protein